MFEYDKGIRLHGSSLWLDAAKTVSHCCVSHAHMDHARRHKHIVATPATVSLIRRRLGQIPATIMPFGAPHVFGQVQVTLFPAGHILGSAQTLVENEAGERLLYSGDFNTEPCSTAESLAYPTCDTLIMECTFGNPAYRFPSRQILAQQLCELVAEKLAQDYIPCIYGYALGKAQEAMKILSDNGFTLSVHGSIIHLAQVYEKHGIDFGSYDRLRADTAVPGRVLILPPAARRQRVVKRLQKPFSIFLTGWGIKPEARFRYGVDTVLPLSDHADFDGLLQYIERVRPKRIYTTHGPKTYYQFLRQQGYDAHPLEPSAQQELF